MSYPIYFGIDPKRVKLSRVKSPSLRSYFEVRLDGEVVGEVHAVSRNADGRWQMLCGEKVLDYTSTSRESAVRGVLWHRTGPADGRTVGRSDGGPSDGRTDGGRSDGRTAVGRSDGGSLGRVVDGRPVPHKCIECDLPAMLMNVRCGECAEWVD